MTIMTSYFGIRNDVINFLTNFHKIPTHCIYLPSFSIIWLESEKDIKKICLFDHAFIKAIAH